MPKAEICKMKKTIALALSLCTLASTLMSCSSSDAGKYSPEITVSSSNAEDYAVWLTNRLGDKLTDSVYLALGSDASRGIDMTDFENDGYIPVSYTHLDVYKRQPTYITNHKNARSLICRIDRDELMSALVRTYLGICLLYTSRCV